MADYSQFLETVEYTPPSESRYSEMTPENMLYSQYLPDGLKPGMDLTGEGENALAGAALDSGGVSASTPDITASGDSSAGVPSPESYGYQGNISNKDVMGIIGSMMGGPLGGLAAIGTAVTNQMAQNQGLTTQPIGTGLFGNAKSILGNVMGMHRQNQLMNALAQPAPSFGTLAGQLGVSDPTDTLGGFGDFGGIGSDGFGSGSDIGDIGSTSSIGGDMGGMV